MNKVDIGNRDGGAASASQQAMDSKYYREARFLLETFNENRMKRRQVEQELKTGCRFTREDALYMIAGVKAVQYDGDHVQTSGNFDRMTDRVLKIDEVLERMNREANNELVQELRKLSMRVALVNTGLTEMDEESRYVVKQRYVDGIPLEEVKSRCGKPYHYKTVMEIMHRGIEQFADYLMITEEIRRRADVEPEKNEYLEGWYD